MVAKESILEVCKSAGLSPVLAGTDRQQRTTLLELSVSYASVKFSAQVSWPEQVVEFAKLSSWVPVRSSLRRK